MLKKDSWRTESVAGPKALAFGPSGDVEGPAAGATHRVGGGFGHLRHHKHTH